MSPSRRSIKTPTSALSSTTHYVVIQAQQVDSHTAASTMPVLRRRSPPSQPMQGLQPDLPQLWKARPPRLSMSPEETSSRPPTSQPRPLVLTSGASNSRPPGRHPDPHRWCRGRQYPLASRQWCKHRCHERQGLGHR